ncbi:MAG: hypothetical protein WAM70_15085 [Pyrinomonadaceae bacterium]
MKAGCQLIVFINPSKFDRMVEGEKTIDNFETPKGGYLNNSQWIVYVDEDCRTASGAFEETTAQKSAVILVPDKISSFSYEPQTSFKILFHTETPATLVAGLEQSPWFRGKLRSEEEETTPYDDLAQAIKASKSFADDLQVIVDKIPSFDPVLEAKLELFQNILNGDSIRPEVVDLLKQSRAAFESDFKEFMKTPRDDLFSKDFHTALSRLRDTLELE